MNAFGRNLACFIILAVFAKLILPASAQDCSSTKAKSCPAGKSEIYRDVKHNGQLSSRLCCKSGSKDAKYFERSATKCRTTKCMISSPQANPCSTMDQRYIGDNKLEYEEVMSDPCSQSDNSKMVALCCQKNSYESLLVTTLGAEQNEFPHQVKLKLPGNCGGTIYNSRWIITAAHCIVRGGKVSDKSKMKVIVGTNIADMSTKDYVFNVISAIPRFNYSKLANHSEFSKGKGVRTFNDIALLELDRDIVFTDKIKALEIASEHFDPFAYADKAIIVGWGTTDTLSTTNHLQKANVILRSDYRCFDERRGLYSKWSEFKDSLLCVGGVLDGKWSYNSGEGDSGGPAICRNKDGNPVLCGVTSIGSDDEKCAKQSNERNCPPSVYTRVGYFRKWIEEIAGPQDPNSLYKPILYGEKVPAGQYKHQVHITKKGGKSCGGTLVAKDVVVTAAQCVSDKDGTKKELSDLTVTTGINDLGRGGGQIFYVKGVQRLSGFRREGEPVDVEAQGKRVRIEDDYYSNDLAVIKLEKETTISKDDLAVLPKSGESYGEGTELSFPRDMFKPRPLTSREFRILDTTECQRRMSRMGRANLTVTVEHSTLCGVEKYSGGSTCDRELGGGLICKGRGGKDVLCGVQIFRLCEFSIPNGFTNMAHYSTWVNDMMNSM